MLAGESEAWRKLGTLDPHKVAECAGAEYWEDDDLFIVPVFGQAFLADPDAREVREIGLHHFHLEKSTHFDLLVPLYLASCTPAEPTGTLISPQSVPGGQAFFKGPHEIPDEVIAHQFGARPEKLVEVGRQLAGTSVKGGDAAVTIPVFPKLPVTIILWVGDLEFPARAQFLFDETAPRHLGIDALWATIIMTAEAVTQLGGPHH